MTLAASSTLARYLFENPWPLGLVLVVAALALAWKGATEGRRPLVIAGLSSLAAAAAVFLTERLVTTPAERADALVRQLVAHAEAAQSSRMLDLFAPKALMHYGRPENPGLPIDEIRAAVGSLETRHRIVSNRITQLDASTESEDAATVVLTCFTDLETGLGTTPSSWWFRVVRQHDDSWKIERMAFLKVAGREATSGLWR